MSLIYLDSAATTLQKPRSVANAAKKAILTLSSPGRGGYKAAMDAADAAFECREKAARLFNVGDPACVVFTANATHALNIAIRSLMRPGDRVVISGYEHNSVVRPLNALGAQIVPVRSPLFDSAAALDAFRKELDEGARLAVCTHVSNVFGFVLPIKEIADACRARGIPLVIDASQSAGALPIDFEALGAAFIAMPGHKGLYGPQGTGLLLCGVMPSPFIYGGTGSSSISREMPKALPDAVEAGTHNMPGILGLSAGLDFVASRGTERILAHEKALISKAAEGLSRLEGVTAYSGGDSAGVLSFTVRGVSCEDVGAALGERGIAVRTGLHCAPEAHRSAGTLATGTVRISVSAFTTQRDIDVFLREMSGIFKKK